MAHLKLNQQHKAVIIAALENQIKKLISLNDNAEDSEIKAIYKLKIELNMEAQEAIEMAIDDIQIKFEIV